MRKALLLLGLMAALAVPAVAAAKAPPSVACGPQCTGGGWTGCTQVTASHSGSMLFIASIRHYLVVNYCKSNGIITSISIAAPSAATASAASSTLPQKPDGPAPNAAASATAA